MSGPNSPNRPYVLTVDETAELLGGISSRSIRNYISEGTLRAANVGSLKRPEYRLLKEDVELLVRVPTGEGQCDFAPGDLPPAIETRTIQELPEYSTTLDVSEFLRLTPQTTRKKFQTGVIPARKIKRRWLVRRMDIAALFVVREESAVQEGQQ